MTRLGKVLILAALLIGGWPLYKILFYYERIEPKAYLMGLDKENEFRLLQGNTFIGSGALGPFLNCLKSYQPITQREVEGSETSSYEIELKDGTIIGISVSNGKAHQFHLSSVHGDGRVSSEGHAISCSLSLLENHVVESL